MRFNVYYERRWMYIANTEDCLKQQTEGASVISLGKSLRTREAGEVIGHPRHLTECKDMSLKTDCSLSKVLSEMVR